MKRLFIFLMCFTSASTFYAQDAVNQPLLDYFQHMDMSQVSTGILKERGFPVFDMDCFNGQALTDSNRMDADRFGWLYWQLTLGNVNTNTTLPDPSTYLNMYENTYMGGSNFPARHISSSYFFQNTYRNQERTAREQLCCDTYYVLRLQTRAKHPLSINASKMAFPFKKALLNT